MKFSLSVIATILAIAWADPAVQAQNIDPLAKQLADLRIQNEELNFLRTTERITYAESQERYKKFTAENNAGKEGWGQACVLTYAARLNFDLMTE